MQEPTSRWSRSRPTSAFSTEQARGRRRPPLAVRHGGAMASGTSARSSVHCFFFGLDLKVSVVLKKVSFDWVIATFTLSVCLLESSRCRAR